MASAPLPETRLGRPLLLGYQSRWVGEQAKLAACEKSRQIGISWAHASIAALRAAARERPAPTYYLSYNHVMTRQFVADVAMWAGAYNLAAGEVEEVVIKDPDGDITAFRVTFATGREVMGLPSEPRVLRSRRGHVVIDEAAYVDDLPALIKAAKAMLVWGWTVRLISSHNGDENDFALLLQAIRDGDRSWALHTFPLAGAVQDGLYRAILRSQGREGDWSPAAEEAWEQEIRDLYGEDGREELDCIPSASSGAYFPASLLALNQTDVPVVSYAQTREFTYEPEAVRAAETGSWIAEHLAPVIEAERRRCEKDPRRRHYLGTDIARSGDLSVISVGAEVAQQHVEGVVHVEMRNMPFSEQQRVLHWIIDHLPYFCAASIDSRGNGQMLAEQAAQKYGPQLVNEVMLSRATYAETFPQYKSRLEDRAYELPRNAGMTADHRQVALDKGVPVIVARRTARGEEQRHGDGAISNMLVVHAIENVDVVYQPATYKRVPVIDARWRLAGGRQLRRRRERAARMSA